MIKVRRIINYIVLIICFSTNVYAQNDSAVNVPPAVVEDDQYITPGILILRRNIHHSFRIINGHGTPTLDKKQLEFCIQHRFGLLSSGYEGAWGLDQSNIRIGLDYGLNRNITIGFGRSGLGKTSNGYIKWGIVKPNGINQYATSLTWLSDMAYVFEKNTTGLTPYYNTHRINYTHQLLISRNFSIGGRHMFMLQLAPTLVHRNLVATSDDANDVPLLVGNVRYRINDHIHLTGEFVQVFNKQITQNSKPAAGIGLEFWTAGHAFQFTFNNANALNEFRYMTGDNGSFGKGDIRLGFNIVRRW